ncbi:hypothetical protein [Methanoculleus sp. 7T]|uniref:hypothetical protein n=1 Tax=Methanoculleus sp. 7T TaxID=2937282 RepID=UPI0020C0BEE9|nr:hypothetical protein [Methanoculleus sp. 7T]MCK8519844.1 hypothetical protein [Methanoculleus sp. 7T]
MKANEIAKIASAVITTHFESEEYREAQKQMIIETVQEIRAKRQTSNKEQAEA